MARSSLTKRLIVRPLKRRLRKRQAARKRQKALVAKAWQPTAYKPQRGVKVPRAKGGGRALSPPALGIDEDEWARAKAVIKAQTKPGSYSRASANRKLAVAKKAANAPGPGFKVTTIEHGTNAGYHAHLRYRSPACPACLKAHAAYNRSHQ